MPTIGYGNDKRTRHMLPNGFKKVVVKNVKVNLFLFFFSGYFRITPL